MALRLQGNDKVEGPVEVELETAISMCSSLVGRSTAVMYGTSPKSPNRQCDHDQLGGPLPCFRGSIGKAVEKATKPGNERALNHFPRFFCVEDVQDPTYRSVQEL